MIVQVILDAALTSRADDPLPARLRKTAEAMLAQELPERAELLVVIHNVPGNSDALALPHDALSSVPQRSDRRLHLVEDPSAEERGHVSSALPDLSLRPFRRVLRLRAGLDFTADPDALRFCITLARDARHRTGNSTGGPMIISSDRAPAWILAVEAPESLAELDGFTGPRAPSRDELGLLAARGGGRAVHAEHDGASGVTTFSEVRLEFSVHAARDGESLSVDCDLGALASADVTVCYYVLQAGSRVARRWYAATTAATFQDIPPDATVRAFLRVGGREIARAESEVL
ncbi:hypothetical protein ACT3SY_17780 [Brachybacterium sp. AOP42-E1-35]|uniref:hypothetical protein n=1 Tax=Brachybacterium sp. AOP42-E1-35 TaxID=3457664 RepID=UPI00402ADF9C